MGDNLTLTVMETIDADPSEVWDALVNPEKIRKYMFGTTVVSEWKEGSAITWKGEWEGKTFEDKGEILQIDREKKLQYTHFSPLSGKEDKPENYHTVTIELASKNTGILVTLTQDNSASEKELEHSKKNWQYMLNSLKKVVEGEDKDN